MCTPECPNPWDAARYVLAGERMLADLAAELVAGNADVADAMFFKSNVDYLSGTTWGCHESYLHTTDPALLPEQIIPHLVSRVIYGGAGGFKPGARSPEFALSPRAWHLVADVSEESTQGRGIFHTKDESLCTKGYHRLHVLAGESLCSHVGNVLKIGTTALVVTMIEAGLRPGDRVRLQSAREALYTFAGDLECKAAARLTNGADGTALTIQRHYLQLAEEHVGRDFMPSWAPDVCRLWRSMLDRLEGAPDSVAASLDWAIKYALYTERARRKGKSWQSLKDEFFEIDARFGQLGEIGIFGAMDRAGVLRHHVEGVDDVDDAVCNPPSVGRARIRGECVKRFASEGGRYSCEWQSIFDAQEERVLDLSDPFATTEAWNPLSKGKAPPFFLHHGLPFMEPRRRRRSSPAARQIAEALSRELF